VRLIRDGTSGGGDAVGVIPAAGCG